LDALKSLSQEEKKQTLNSTILSKNQERSMQPAPKYQGPLPQLKGTIYTARLCGHLLEVYAAIITSTIATTNYPTETPRFRSKSLS
jgi:hypothetical protein